MEPEYFYGVFFMVIVDALTVAANFVVRERKVSAPDVVLSKGIFQIIISMFVIIFSASLNSSSLQCLNKRNRDDVRYEKIVEDIKEKPTVREAVLPSKWSDKNWAILFGFLGGIKHTTAFVALHFMPVSDFTLFATTMVIFTYVFGYFMIGTKLTCLKSLPCFMLLGGICLALKPSFIFEHNNIGTMDRATFTKHENIKISKIVNGNEYWIGILLSLLFSLSAAINKIIPKKCRNVSCITILLWSGIGDILAAFLAYVIPDMQLHLLSPKSLTETQLLVIVSLGIISIVTNFLIIYSDRIGSPVINSVVRRSEILLVVLIDMAYFRQYPDTIEAVGYSIVFASVIFKIAADKFDW